jgi:glucose-6-phosphate isomerase
MGQWIQDGKRNAFETFLIEEKPDSEIEVPALGEDLDGLEYLAGKTLGEINLEAYRGTAAAHFDGGMPNHTLLVETLNEAVIGQLIHFFERACGVACYLGGINPFDQPGVEAYKKNMFALLGKAGFETLGAELRAKIG